MIQTTIKDIYEKKVTADRSHVIYIIWEGETCIYVGKGETSKGIMRRLLNRQHDDLYYYLLRRFPASLEFRVELLTIADCLARAETFSHRMGWPVQALECEAELIRLYQPALNRSHNVERNPYRNRNERQDE